jgi:NAD(P)-dependent dehydrogenase (short-subunit alcohol dehydrogenase family)
MRLEGSDSDTESKGASIMGALDGRVAVVTGGTSGIGARTALLFAEEGARLVLGGRREEEGQAIVSELGKDAAFVRTDVSVESDVKALIAFACERHGRLDCLVNNAGEGGTPGGIVNVDLGPLKHMLAVHVGGAVAGMKYAAPVMVGQRSGSIINVASIGGHIAGWTFLDYSAAKAAIIHLTRCVAAELGEHGVRVNCISPGPIMTGIFAKGAGMDPAQADSSADDLESVFLERLELYQPIRRAGRPADVAPVVLWLASDASSFVTGQDIAVDGGISAGRPPSASAADFTAIGKQLLGSAGA